MKYNILTLFLSALVVVGCTTNHSGFTDDDESISGIEGTGDVAITASITSGTVTGFGSVYVNGIHFNTDNAVVEIDGVEVDEQSLDIGMVVTVEAQTDKSSNQSIAVRVTADSLIKGEVSHVEEKDLTLKTLNILGQTVFVTEHTTFRNLSFDEIQAGITLHVNGFSSNDGTVAATHIVKVMNADDTLAELEGNITDIDTGSSGIFLNNFSVNYSQAKFEGGDIRDLSLNKRIEIIGQADYDKGTMDANIVRFKQARPHRAGEHTTIEGIASDLVEDSHFYLGNTKINIESSSLKTHNITNGSRVIVKGRHDEAELKANNVYLRQHTFNSFKGPLTEVDAAENTIRIFDKTIVINEFTAFDDRKVSPNRFINIEDLRIGEHLEVFAALIDDQWVASKIRRVPSFGGNQSLRGVVSEVTSPTRFSVAGISVDADEVDPESLQNIAVGAKVSIDGDHVGTRQFKARTIRVHEDKGCDERIFFECFERKTSGFKGFKAKNRR